LIVDGLLDNIIEVFDLPQTCEARQLAAFFIDLLALG